MNDSPAVIASAALEAVCGTPSVEQVRALEAELRTLPPADIQMQHTVFAGMYARTALIPAGCCLTGALTKADNVCVMYGDILVTTDDGPQRLTGFNVLTAKAGAKRVGVALADTWWTTLVATDEAEVDAIERQMTDETLGAQRQIEVVQ